MAHSIFVHDFSRYEPDAPVVCGKPDSSFDEALMSRISSALLKSVDGSTHTNIDVWTQIISTHIFFIDLIRNGDLRGANEILGRMFSTNLTYGFEQRPDMYKNLCENPAGFRHIRIFAIDKLLSLAEYLRAIPVQNVEQGDFLPFLKETPDQLFDRIEAKIGIKIRAPSFQGALFGIETKLRGQFTERSIAGLYAALRMREILQDSRSPRICEIGGGTGYVAYYCNMLGLTDYTIVDLPTVSAVQAYFLAKNIGPEGVSFVGETHRDPEARVKLIGEREFLSSSGFDLLVNIDSFPEMGGEIMRRYLSHGRSSARMLLSMNQEALASRSAGGDVQERVGDVIDDIGGYRRLARFPFWMRPGYVEEIYEPIARKAISS